MYPVGKTTVLESFPFHESFGQRLTLVTGFDFIVRFLQGFWQVTLCTWKLVQLAKTVVKNFGAITTSGPRCLKLSQSSRRYVNIYASLEDFETDSARIVPGQATIRTIEWQQSSDWRPARIRRKS